MGSEMNSDINPLILFSSFKLNHLMNYLKNLSGLKAAILSPSVVSIFVLIIEEEKGTLTLCKHCCFLFSMKYVTQRQVWCIPDFTDSTRVNKCLTALK